MGAATGIGADQHAAPRPAGQLRQRQPGHLDVLGRGVRSGVPGAQQDGQGLPACPIAVVGERSQRMEPIGLLPGRSGFLFLRVRQHDRRVDVHRDQRRVPAGGAVAGQRPGAHAGCRPGPADRPQRPRALRGQRADQAGDHRIRRHRPRQLRLGAQHRDISQAVPTQGECHGQVGQDLPRVVHRPRRPPPGQGAGQALAQPSDPQRLGQQQPTGLGHQPLTIGRHGDLGTAHGIVHPESAFGSARTGS